LILRRFFAGALVAFLMVFFGGFRPGFFAVFPAAA